MNIKAEIIERKNVNIDPKDIVPSLLNHYNWSQSSNSIICVEEINGIECITKSSDHSYHGSPDYQIDKIISKDIKDIELFKLLMKLQEMILERENK